VGNEIEIQPKGVLPVARSMPVTFNCTKRHPGNLFGWRIHFTDELEISFITNPNSLSHGIYFNASLVSEDVIILEFESDEIIDAIECQYFDDNTGSIIRSNSTSILIAGKVALFPFCIMCI